MGSKIVKEQLDQIRQSRAFNLVAGRADDQVLRYGKVSQRTVFHLSGGIGDIIVSLGVVNQIAQNLKEQPIIYSSHPEIVKIYSSFESRHYKDLQPHDYWILVNLVGAFKFSGNFKGYRDPYLNDLFLRNEIVLRTEGWSKYVKTHPHGDNFIAHKALKMGLNRETLPYHFFNLPFKKLIAPPLFRNNDLPEKYITIHNGFDTNNKIDAGRSTKNWLPAQWKYLVMYLRERYPEYKVIQLGARNSLPILDVDINMLGKDLLTSLRTLAYSSLHIDGDSGLVHAAHTMDVKSVVLFGPTNIDFFGYKENLNIKSETCGDCWWLSDEWNSKCVLGHSVPPCLWDLKPHHVFKKILASGIL